MVTSGASVARSRAWSWKGLNRGLGVILGNRSALNLLIVTVGPCPSRLNYHDVVLEREVRRHVYLEGHDRPLF